MSESGRIWLGYCPGGGRAYIETGDAGCRVLILGSRAKDISALAALSAKEAGTKPIIFDLHGDVMRRLSGYFDAYDYHSFLYDAFRLEAPEPWHSQLAAGAYANSLDLTSVEEAVVNSAFQLLAAEGGMASPASLYDSIGGVGGFKAAFVDGLKGRNGSLKLFDAVDDKASSLLLNGNAVVDFHSSPYPQAAELAASLILAKLLALAHARGEPHSTLFLTESDRIFKSRPRPLRSCRLLSQLLDWGFICFSSDQRQALDPQVLDACPVQIYSSDAWHAVSKDDGCVLSGACVVQDLR